MNNYQWFECKVNYNKKEKNGADEKTTASYLINALSFTEAEARIIQELKPYISESITIVDIKRAKLSDLFFNENGDRYFKAKLYFTTIDQKTELEKKTMHQMLIEASNIDEALVQLRNELKTTITDYTIASISETSIRDAFKTAKR